MVALILVVVRGWVGAVHEVGTATGPMRLEEYGNEGGEHGVQEA